MTDKLVSYTDAAEQVLRNTSPGAPLHYRDLTARAIEAGLVKPGGSTPEASMNASINMEIRRRSDTSRAQRFRAHGKGFYGLAATNRPLEGGINENNRDVRRRLGEIISELDPEAFEHLIGRLLVSLGFDEVEVTQYHGDKGVDLRAVLRVGGITQVQTAVQVKRWANNVGAPDVRQLRGGLGPHERGLVISSGGFSKGAREEAAEANRSPISLVDGEQLIELLIEHRIGVTARAIEILELDETGIADFSADFVSSGPGSTQFRTIWPLPGGGDNWKRALDQMLDFVADSGPTVDEGVAWLIEQHDRVASPKTSRSYWGVPRSLGLTEMDGEHLSLTGEGVAYRSDPNLRALLSQLTLNVLGIDEILERLQSGPATSGEILELMRTRCGVDWETDTQVGFRMQWLATAGVVRKDGQQWFAESTNV